MMSQPPFQETKVNTVDTRTSGARDAASSAEEHEALYSYYPMFSTLLFLPPQHSALPPYSYTPRSADSSHSSVRRKAEGPNILQ